MGRSIDLNTALRIQPQLTAEFFANRLGMPRFGSPFPFAGVARHLLIVFTECQRPDTNGMLARMLSLLSGPNTPVSDRGEPSGLALYLLAPVIRPGTDPVARFSAKPLSDHPAEYFGV